ncbi:MAG: hypothetical protein JO046_11010 [Solirubrobacterales bacterium]|nr:hypothetical protein [Solirubrobacterales bacterium]
MITRSTAGSDETLRWACIVPPGDAEVVSGVGVDPLKPAGLVGEDLLAAGQEVEVLGILVAVQWHDHPRGNHAA